MGKVTDNFWRDIWKHTMYKNLPNGASVIMHPLIWGQLLDNEECHRQSLKRHKKKNSAENPVGYRTMRNVTDNPNCPPINCSKDNSRTPVEVILKCIRISLNCSCLHCLRPDWIPMFRWNRKSWWLFFSCSSSGFSPYSGAYYPQEGQYSYLLTGETIVL